MATRETLAGLVARGKLQGAIVLVAAALLAATGASAQEYRGTADQQQACMGDVFRLCSAAEIAAAALGDRSGIYACFRAHRPDLSPACDRVLKSHGY